jgi:hypothetical protein
VVFVLVCLVALPAAVFAQGSETRPLKLSRSDLQLVWGITAPDEQACGGGRIAGGYIEGSLNLSHLGRSSIEMSAAWDIDQLITPQFTPVGPAGGPVARVLEQNDYPYQFQHNPFGPGCGTTVSATGDVVLTAANGDQVFGKVVGGETHRLDFIVAGDGIETFAIVEIVGGTGRFDGATGNLVVHTISRFNIPTLSFVIDLAEVLPGGTIGY